MEEAGIELAYNELIKRITITFLEAHMIAAADQSALDEAEKHFINGIRSAKSARNKALSALQKI
jgi:hypothetical protein